MSSPEVIETTNEDDEMATTALEMPDFDDEAATTGLTAIRERPDLTVEFAKQLLTNPVTNASGTISLSSRKAVNLGQFGLLFTKTQGNRFPA